MGKVPTYKFHIVGAAPTPLRDAFHTFLRIPWPAALGMLVGAWLVLNAIFALGYVFTGGLENARPGSYWDAYIFSVQTMGTIGYGAIYPKGTGAHILVDVEAVTSLICTALATGLVFSKFARSNARIAFSEKACITLQDGQPTLMIRFGNERGNRIVDTEMRIAYSFRRDTAEGVSMYRLIDLKLGRDHAPALARSFTITHVIDEESPLYGKAPAQLKDEETELMVTVVGLDDVTSQTVHASFVYEDHEIVFGARHADLLSTLPNGDIQVDLTKFHAVVPTKRTADFPYP